jgi:hypothetical protein
LSHTRYLRKNDGSIYYSAALVIHSSSIFHPHIPSIPRIPNLSSSRTFHFNNSIHWGLLHIPCDSFRVLVHVPACTARLSRSSMTSTRGKSPSKPMVFNAGGCCGSDCSYGCLFQLRVDRVGRVINTSVGADLAWISCEVLVPNPCGKHYPIFARNVGSIAVH